MLSILKISAVVRNGQNIRLSQVRHPHEIIPMGGVHAAKICHGGNRCHRHETKRVGKKIKHHLKFTSHQRHTSYHPLSPLKRSTQVSISKHLRKPPRLPQADEQSKQCTLHIFSSVDSPTYRRSPALCHKYHLPLPFDFLVEFASHLCVQSFPCQKITNIDQNFSYRNA